MVTGAVAAILYGRPRFTGDVDIVVSIDNNAAQRLLRAFPPREFYVPPDEAVQNEIAREQHGHFNVIHVASGYKADFYPAGVDALNAWGLANRVPHVTPRGTVWAAPAEYVILLKLQYWREGDSPKHADDISAMLRVLGDRVDRAFIEREAKARGVSAQWESVAHPTG